MILNIVIFISVAIVVFICSNILFKYANKQKEAEKKEQLLDRLLALKADLQDEVDDELMGRFSSSINELKKETRKSDD